MTFVDHLTIYKHRVPIMFHVLDGRFIISQYRHEGALLPKFGNWAIESIVCTGSPLEAEIGVKRIGGKRTRYITHRIKI